MHLYYAMPLPYLGTLSQDNLGAPLVYALAESLRSWLEEHNEPPGDGSGFEEMVRDAVLRVMSHVIGAGRISRLFHRRCAAKKPPPRQPRRLPL